MVSKTTYWKLSVEGEDLGLCVWGAGCFYGVGTYLYGTVGQRLSLLFGFRTYLQGTVGLGLQHVYMVSEPTYLGMYCIAKVAFILAIYNASNSRFTPLCHI